MNVPLKLLKTAIKNIFIFNISDLFPFQMGSGLTTKMKLGVAAAGGGLLLLALVGGAVGWFNRDKQKEGPQVQ